MRLLIHGTEYEVSTSFMTLLRYRAEYGQSFLNENRLDQEKLIQLIYEGLSGERPHYHKFRAEALTDGKFMAAAISFYNRLTKSNEKHAAKDAEPQDVDEYKILALYAAAGLPERLLDELTIFNIADIIGVYYDIRSGKQHVRKMSASERKALYGITPERERAVEEYLKRGDER